ncbi:MAG: NUDIX domain-containing protein [Kofleriaceae bacterium]
MTEQADYLARVAAQRQVRLSVRSICIRNGQLLVQRAADDPSSCHAFVGGRMEHGDTFERRIRAEYDEEIGGVLSRVSYLFVVENRFRVAEGVFHAVEHFLEVELAPGEIGTREAHLIHSWVPLADLAALDLRPHVVRDALVDGSWRAIRHLQVPLDE